LEPEGGLLTLSFSGHRNTVTSKIVFDKLQF
jgi:hypothetical protein